MKNKNALMYSLLVILVLFLFLPPALRHFAKDAYGSKVPKNDYVVEVLNCTKLNETINTSYVNGKAHNFQYQLLENSALMIDDSGIVNNIINYAKVEKSATSGVTEYRIELNKLAEVPTPLQNYVKNIDDQSEYYRELGFSCSKTKA